jgi:predicted DNA-binding ribbon-helix-helix protein
MVQRIRFLIPIPSCAKADNINRQAVALALQHGEDHMCRIFAGQSPETYSYKTRSIRLGGHSTSIRLEAAFWTILEEVAASQSLSLPKFVTTLHDEVLELGGETGNFTSLLRCVCLTYLGQFQDRRAAGRPVPAEAGLGTRSSRPNVHAM